MPSSNLRKTRSSCISRPKILLLGISYPDVAKQMEDRGFHPDVLIHKEPSVAHCVECVRRGILTEMDARDLARCIMTEQVYNVDVYTVSKEVGAIYRSDRHVHANFNSRTFLTTLKDAFGDVRFSQIILDYYWMPSGWLVTRWATTLFQRTLVEFVKQKCLDYEKRSTGRRRLRRSSSEPSNKNELPTHGGLDEGVVYLPFCSHVCKELVGGIHRLAEYYAITFVSKQQLSGHALWKGTMEISPDDMQHRLGKRLDQEEVYCTFRPADIFQNMEDSHVEKDEVLRMLLSIERYPDIRMVRLRPLQQHDTNVKRPIEEEGGFHGLNHELGKQLYFYRRKHRTPAILVHEKPAVPRFKKRPRPSPGTGTSNQKKQRMQTPIPLVAPVKIPETPSIVSMEEETDEDDEEDIIDFVRREYLEVPEFTFFFPGPAKNLQLYQRPPELVGGQQPWKRIQTKSLLECSFQREHQDDGHALKNNHSVNSRLFLSQNPRVPIISIERRLHGGCSTEHLRQIVRLELGLSREANDADDKRTEQELIDDDLPLQVRDAASLFALRNFNLITERKRKKSSKSQPCTCFVIPRAEVEQRIGKGRLVPTFGEGCIFEDEDDAMELDSSVHLDRGFASVVQCSRERDTALLLSSKEKTQFAQRQKGLATEKSIFPLNRKAHLHLIMKWILCDRPTDLDASGMFAQISKAICELPSTPQNLVEEAIAIERILFLEVRDCIAAMRQGQKTGYTASARQFYFQEYFGDARTLWLDMCRNFTH